jgi:Ulp1 family protease
MRLTDGELLNDNMVDLQIKRLVIWKKYYDLHKDDEFQNMSEKDCWLHFDQKYLFSASPTLRATTSESESPVTIIESDHNTSSIYAFSSMFYQKLTERKKSESYELVKKWTKNVDLFSKEFIFIPINMGSHWSLLCIVRPGLIRKEVKIFPRSFFVITHFSLPPLVDPCQKIRWEWKKEKKIN